jgi:hypothetical protein
MHQQPAPFKGRQHQIAPANIGRLKRTDCHESSLGTVATARQNLCNNWRKPAPWSCALELSADRMISRNISEQTVSNLDGAMTEHSGQVLTICAQDCPSCCGHLDQTG